MNAATVREQLQLNGLSASAEVVQAAVADAAGTLTFRLSTTNANSHLVDFAAPLLSEAGEAISVPTLRLDDFVASHPWPTVIKMDIEGAEVAALRGSEALLSSPRRPTLLISTHSDDLDRECKAIIKRHQYDFINLKGFEQMIYARPDLRGAAQSL